MIVSEKEQISFWLSAFKNEKNSTKRLWVWRVTM